jgi:hypothetical protein
VRLLNKAVTKAMQNKPKQFFENGYAKFDYDENLHKKYKDPNCPELKDFTPRERRQFLRLCHLAGWDSAHWDSGRPFLR